jgi:ferredoxin-NADP reductase
MGRVQELEVVVEEVVSETPDTVTLVLEGSHAEYRAGHFLTIDPHQFGELARPIDELEDKKARREPPRAYSLASAPDEPRLAITIKQEPFIAGVTAYAPLLSPLLVRGVHPGRRLSVRGFAGSYTLPEDVESIADHVVHVCAGSGSVPNFAMLKHALRELPRLRHTFIYSNKTWEDVIYRGALSALGARHPDRLRVVHALTREPPPGRSIDGAEVRSGRIGTALLHELIPDPSASLVLTCGPGITPWDRVRARAAGHAPAPRFLESVIEALAQVGVPTTRIRREAYG